MATRISRASIALRFGRTAGRLGPVVVLAGAGSLGIEICASRLVAPYFGDTIDIWATIIGIILAALSTGYWYGGRVADRHPSPKLLGGLILCAAVLTALLPFVARPILTATVTALGGAGRSPAAFTGVLLLFSLPVALLGMVAPFALRLSIMDVGSVGAVSGRLYSLSTLGSIAGTFVTALVSIPLMGTQRTLICTAVLLCLAALPLLTWRALLAALLAAALLVLPPSAIRPVAGVLLAESESQYQYIQVIQRPNDVRYMLVGDGYAFESEWRPGTVLTDQYFDSFLMLPRFLDHPVRNVLIIGNGGGTIGRSYGRFYPDAAVEGVELDPEVTRLGMEYFNEGDNPRQHVTTTDGRTFLRSASQKYDIIIVDAYHAATIPFHLATAEFFQEAADHLNPGGILAANVLDPTADFRLHPAIERTVSAVMGPAWVSQDGPRNELIFAMRPALDRAALIRRSAGVEPALQFLVPKFTAPLRPAARTGPVLTDDLAAVDLPARLPSP